MKAPAASHLIEQLRQCRQARRAELEVEEPRVSDGVGVAEEGGDLRAGDQQRGGEGVLQLADIAELGDRVVVRDRHEIETRRLRRFEGEHGGAGPARIALVAGAVRMRGVDMEVAAPPAGRRRQRLREIGKLHRAAGAIGRAELDRGGVARGLALADVGNAKHEMPCAGLERAGGVGRRCAELRDFKVALVAAAPAALAIGIAQADVDHRALVLAGVS